MITSSQLGPRMAAFSLAVGITFAAGAGLANQTYNPAENTSVIYTAAAPSPYVGAYAVSVLTLIDQEAKVLVA